MLTGAQAIKEWFKANPKEEDDPSLGADLVGPVVQLENIKARYVICYDPTQLKSIYNGNKEAAKFDNALPYQIHYGKVEDNGGLSFDGDTSEASFLTFEALVNWLAKHNSPITAEWGTYDEVPINWA